MVLERPFRLALVALRVIICFNAAKQDVEIEPDSTWEGRPGRVHTHTHIHTCIHTYIHTHIHTYIHIQTYTCTHVRKGMSHFFMRNLFMSALTSCAASAIKLWPAPGRTCLTHECTQTAAHTGELKAAFRNTTRLHTHTHAHTHTHGQTNTHIWTVRMLHGLVHAICH